MRPLLALLLCCFSVAAQESFSDPDFEFAFNSPEGMFVLSPEELGEATAQSPELFRPLPRSESPDGLALHDYRWRDASGHNRDISLTLKDVAPGETIPFISPDDFAAVVEANFGVEVAPEDRGFLRRGEIIIGMRLEAERTTPKGELVRQVWTFYPLNDGDRYALMWFSALVADWQLYEPAFDVAIASVKFPLPQLALEQAKADAERRRNPTAGSNVKQAEQSWGTLEVTGSLILVVLLLVVLFMGSSSEATTA